MDNNTKKCPFCAELINIEAVKCKHCGQFLTENQDKIIFQDDKVLVSLTRYKVMDTIYAMKDITSVTLIKEAANRIVPYILYGVALIHTFWKIDFISQLLFNNFLDQFIILGLGLLVNFFLKDKYFVTITNNSNQINTLQSLEKVYVTKVVDAINQAIIQRG